MRNVCYAVGGSDSSGYANLARSLTSGAVVAPIPELAQFALPDSAAPVFVPLGYAALPARRAMAPMYPLGFPLHVAGAGVLFGWERAPYLIGPLAAVLAILLTYGVGRRLGLEPPAAAGAAVLFAACPTLIFHAVQPLSDVVAALWCLAAIAAALRARSTPGWAAASGFAFGVAVLVRPLDALLLAPLVFALPASRKAWMGFAFGGAPCAAVLLGYDAAVFGHALQTGYAVTGHWSHFAAAHVPLQARRYAGWCLDVLTPVVALGGLAVAVDRRVPWRDRALLVSWFVVFFVGYSFYGVGDVWWYTRFLLPGMPAVFVGFARAVQDLAALPSAPSRRRAAAAAAIVAVLVLAWLGFRHARLWGALALKSEQASFPEASRWAARTAPREAFVLSKEMSGALKYYTNLSPVRWDLIDARTFRELAASAAGRSRPWYALLKRPEVAQAAPVAPGRWRFLGERGDVSLWRLEEPAP